jgi:orotate phosphoribosyltransferase
VSLFALGEFKLHSGGASRWRINCDSLTSGDWKALAVMLAERLPPFGRVVGVPRGGLPLATALRPCCRNDTARVLAVDDVLTTGSSLEKCREWLLAEGAADVMGAVVFARGLCPPWVYPLFQMLPGRAGGA